MFLLLLLLHQGPCRDCVLPFVNSADVVGGESNGSPRTGGFRGSRELTDPGKNWHFSRSCNSFRKISNMGSRFHSSVVRFLVIARGEGGGRGYSPKFRIGVCRERSQTLTLSKDKENEN